MAAASDKARFYLEQYVPELREYESKHIFSRDEIASITSKRSDFEHTLNARGSSPDDYVRYADYEINLHALRKKRCKRLGVKATAFSAQRTVFFILDRATKKFPGDKGLWMRYIQFCMKEKASKKLARLFTQLLRLHPRDYALWVLAAKHYAETQGDMATARSYMQRGLRFCRDEERLYREYARLEMGYLAKLAARRAILGLDGKSDTGEVAKVAQDEDADMIALPTLTAADLDHAHEGNEGAPNAVEDVSVDLLKRLETAPAFTGGIPMAIFDAAVQQFGDSAPIVAEDFYHLVAELAQVPCTSTVLQHILHWLHTNAPESVETISCGAKHELFSIEATSELFPAALSKFLARIQSGSRRLQEKHRPELAEKTVLTLLPYLRLSDELDVSVVKVLESTISRHLRTTTAAPRKLGGKPTGPAAIAARLQSDGKDEDMEALLRLVGEVGLG